MTTIKKDHEILSYRPSIEYKKEVKSTIEPKTQSADLTSPTRTQTLTELLKYAPSKVYREISQSIQLLKEKQTTLSRYLSQRPDTTTTIPFSQFELLLSKKEDLKADELETLDDYHNSHKDQIEGVYGVEIYYHVYQSIVQLQRLLNAYSQYAYGTVTPVDEQFKQEEASQQLMQNLELQGRHRSINYASLSVDAQMGRTVLELSESVKGFALELYNSFALPDDVPNVEAGLGVQRILDMFDELRGACQDDADKLEFYYNRQLFETIISKIKGQRRQMVAMLKEKERLEIASQTDDYIRSYVQMQSEEVFSGLAELVRFSRSLEMYLTDLSHTTQEKEVFRQIYDNLV